MSWSMDDAAMTLAAGLRRHEAALLAEQAVHGLDSLDEVSLHPLLGDAWRESGYAVFRETPYPGQPEVLPKESQRERCDLVVAPAGTLAISDSIQRRKELRRAEGTLFAPVAERVIAAPDAAIEPDDALWIEVKTIGQYTYTDGFAGPNRTYASQFATCVADVRKLARAARIQHAALAIVLFTADETVAGHDLTTFVHRCLDRDLPVAGLICDHCAISDRIGNSVCTLGLVPVRSSRPD